MRREISVKANYGVVSNRDRGNMIIEAEGLQDQIRYEGGYQEILYYAGFTRTFIDTGLLDQFDNAWKQLFRDGEAQQIIHKYGLEPAKITQ